MALDGDGYPTDESIEYIKSWGYDVKTLPEFLAYLHDTWWAPEGGFRIKTRSLELATGGWSGNEETAGALQHNFIFWALHWKMSKRGGLDVFEIPRSVATKLKALVN